MVKSESDINNVRAEAEAMQVEGENPFWGLTYLDGVVEALRWAVGDSDASPLE